MLGNLTNLVQIYLSQNNLSGPIPKEIGILSRKFENLDFSSNNLTRDNNITGSVPDCFQNDSLFTSLNVYDKRLQGLVPRSLVNCSHLEVLDLGKNRISDMFPSWLDSLPHLQVLVLKSNSLFGAIQTSSSEHPFQKLRILDLSRNFLNGLLPSRYFDNYEAMMDIHEQAGVPEYMGRDGIYKDSVELVVKGSELEFERILAILTAKDISNNNFEGEIPSNIRMLNSLRYLNISQNHLNGQIPALLRNLTTLESLDLSSNQLKGKIPSELTSLTFLAVFNVSSNQLLGTIPQGGQFDTYDNTSYQENPTLCGCLLPKCGRNEVTTLPLSPQQEDSSTFFYGFTWESVVLVSYLA